MSKKKITRNFQSLTWENRSIEEYDLLRHFIEINNCFPNNTLYMGNDIHGYISYDLLDEIIKEKGCSHEFDRDSKKFCSECGKQAWNEYEKEYDYEDIENALGEKGLDYVTCGENDEGPYVGWSLAGKGGKRAAKKQLEELNRINDLLKEMFGREGDFYSGSYYS